jgi:hypothetical protein
LCLSWKERGYATTGNNLRNIELETGSELEIEDLEYKINPVCDMLSFAEIPEGELWIIDAVKVVSLIKSNHLSVDGFANDEIEEIIRLMCTS